MSDRIDRLAADASCASPPRADAALSELTSLARRGERLGRRSVLKAFKPGGLWDFPKDEFCETCFYEPLCDAYTALDTEESNNG